MSFHGEENDTEITWHVANIEMGQTCSLKGETAHLGFISGMATRLRCVNALSQDFKVLKTKMVTHIISSPFQRGLILNPVSLSPSTADPNAHTQARGMFKSHNLVLSRTGLGILHTAHLQNRRQGLVGRNVFQKEVTRIWKKQKFFTLREQSKSLFSGRKTLEEQ